MNRALKVIQGHPYWCRQESRTVCCRNVQLINSLLFGPPRTLYQGLTFGRQVSLSSHRIRNSAATSAVRKVYGSL